MPAIIGGLDRYVVASRLVKKLSPSFRGAPKARTRNPEKQEIPMLLDSGPAASRRPGMTTESFSSAC
jgi:hypothetical protein